MIEKKDNEFLDLKRIISRERKSMQELASLVTSLNKMEDREEKDAVIEQMRVLKGALRSDGRKVVDMIGKLSMAKPILQEREYGVYEKGEKKEEIPKKKISEFKARRDIEKTIGKKESLILEKGILKRLRKKEEKKKIKKEKKVNPYVGFASKIFAERAREMIKKGKFEAMRLDLSRASLRIAPTGYVSSIFLTTIIAAIAGFLIFLVLLFFKLSVVPPFISLTKGNLVIRALKFILIPIVLPILTFVGLYLYPTLEKRSNETFINRELPFATIHMSSIAGSLIEPTKIFSIIISTQEYPYLEKEFKKLINEINIYGYDLVTALRNGAFRSPSKKLSELYNGLAITINSGGDLANFFEKRSESLLLEHRLEREKYTKTTETFMDIYISIVVAAPMILMLLLMMMQISGLGISLSSTAISLIMVLGVTVINIFFLTFLHLKQPGE